MADMEYSTIRRAADLIEDADGLVVAAGAGMGIERGLPDFRGPDGFWAAYPAFGRRGLESYEVTNPRTFREGLGRAPVSWLSGVHFQCGWAVPACRVQR